MSMWVTKLFTAWAPKRTPGKRKDHSIMADKSDNYIAVLFMAGGVAIIGSVTPFLFLCFARESGNQTDEAITDTVH